MVLFHTTEKYQNGKSVRRDVRSGQGTGDGYGYWKATGKDKKIEHEGEILGSKRMLVFHIGKGPKGSRTNWLMQEYRASDKIHPKNEGTSMRLDDCVLCKVYQNLRDTKKSAKAQPSEDVHKRKRGRREPMPVQLEPMPVQPQFEPMPIQPEPKPMPNQNEPQPVPFQPEPEPMPVQSNPIWVNNINFPNGYSGMAETLPPSEPTLAPLPPSVGLNDTSSSNTFLLEQFVIHSPSEHYFVIDPTQGYDVENQENYCGNGEVPIFQGLDWE
ncbi:uncharacterized protein LOC143878291 [Tasmannia lanceolata]|uniref:uncharacterized protein LOC143878291 n=1 Tax=Tasmannia lanceolata TaxID=3420 RepID=UPI0040641EB0